MTTAAKRKADQPYSTFSRATRTAVKRVEQYATPGSVSVAHMGNGHEQIDAVIGRYELQVRLSAGKIDTVHTRPVGAVDEPQSDYYPGTWWHSLSAGIDSCLPDLRATARPLEVGTLTGALTVNIYRHGARLKPVAYIELYLTNHPTYYGSLKVKKVKSGQLLHLCQAFVAAGGQDAGCTSALLDWLEEHHERAGQYLQDARNPPPRRPLQPGPVFTF